MPPPLDLFVLTLFFLIVGLAAAWDVFQFRIPNILCLVIAALYPIYAIGSSQMSDIPGALAVATTVLAVGIVVFCLGLIGGGDVKLLAAVSLWAGPSGILDLLLTTTIIGAAMGILVLVARQQSVMYTLTRFGAGAIANAAAGNMLPYGVAIAAATYLTVGPLVFASP